MWRTKRSAKWTCYSTKLLLRFLVVDRTLPPDGAAWADARPSLSRLGLGAEAWEPSAISTLTISGP
eukprot:6187812-Pleurochrysis_carterae.AAC.3